MKTNFSFSVRTLFVLSFLLLTCPAILAQSPKPVSDVKTGIVTLFARDPLAKTFCFEAGEFGSIFQKNEVRNRCSDINFNGFRTKNDPDIFSVAIEGARKGAIVDLGTPEDLQAKYGYLETVGGGQGFASLEINGQKVFVLKELRTHTTQELLESEALFQSPMMPTASLPVKLGHIYIMRMADRNDKEFELFVKLLVIAHDPLESVTIRWQVM